MALLPATSFGFRLRPAAVRDAGEQDDGGLLATAIAGPPQRRLAFAVIVLSTVAFLAAAPAARVPLPQIPAFIPAYESSLVVIDLITALMLFGQFAQLRSAALLALAAGYLFDGLMVIPHALSFPGLVSPTGWLGAGSQTTAWLYMFWHAGFAILVLAYAGLNRRDRRSDRVRLRAWSGLSAGMAVIAVSIFLTLLATTFHDLLPDIMVGNAYTPAMKFVVGTVWALTLAALLALAWNRPHSMLDLWLIVVMLAWLFDIALSAVLNAGRFDLGFYGGRMFGLLSSSLVLGVLLVETNALQTRLAAATAQLADHARDLDRHVRERTAELARTNRHLNAILDASPLAIFMIDPDGTVLMWTASAERIFGYSEVEALGRIPPYLTDEHIADFQAILARSTSNAAATGFIETQRRHRDGRLIDVSISWARVNGEDGQMLGIMCLVADTTERKKLERQLLQAQKMEAVGNLTGGLAHDFNNLLGIVILNLDLLSEARGSDPEIAELSHEAMDAALRGAELIRRLLAFARRQPLRATQTDVNALVTEITRLLARTLGEDISIDLELQPEVWPTVVDPAQLEASLANLATNARDAMAQGGHLTIATGNRHLDEDYAAQHAEVLPGDYAMIEVSDSGAGMSPEVLAQVFEPFYTTKAPGKGTGLGLSMVYGFIKQSGGHINIYSEVGVGTTVRLYLPRSAVAGDMPDEAPPPPVARGRGETILAVEDNPSLRLVVARQLGDLGYRVVEAGDADSALAVLESEPVAVLFTDVVLPGGTSGHELARIAQARWPAIKIVLTSGFPENRIPGDGELPGLKLLSKPYRREDIGRLVHEVLTG
jgi:PAS domain S-box-containing protein